MGHAGDEFEFGVVSVIDLLEDEGVDRELNLAVDGGPRPHCGFPVFVALGELARAGEEAG